MPNGFIKRSGAQAWLCLLALVFIPGCFDYEVGLKLKDDGGGEVTTNAVFSAQRKEAGMPEQLKTLLAPKPTASASRVAGKWVVSESTAFRTLPRLKMRRLRFKVELLDVGLILAGTPSYRFYAWLMPTGQDRDDRTVGQGMELDDRQPRAKKGQDQLDMKVARLYARSLGKHYFQLKVEVPGKVLKARSWVVGSHKIVPRVSDDKSTVTWRLPLAMLVNENARSNLLFTADFKGEFVAGKGYAAVQSTMPGDAAAAAKGTKGLPGKAGPGGITTDTGTGGGPGGAPTTPSFIGVTPRDKY